MNRPRRPPFTPARKKKPTPNRGPVTTGPPRRRSPLDHIPANIEPRFKVLGTGADRQALLTYASPMEMLVVPRVIGLVITLPLLTFFSDVMGLFGGAMISRFLLDVAPLQYVDRVRHAVDASDLFVGLFKAPIFGFLIAVIGCMHGLRVRGSAESVGGETTRAVVKAIFVVIVLDALFSILFEKLGL